MLSLRLWVKSRLLGSSLVTHGFLTMQGVHNLNHRVVQESTVHPIFSSTEYSKSDGTGGEL